MNKNYYNDYYEHDSFKVNLNYRLQISNQLMEDIHPGEYPKLILTRFCDDIFDKEKYLTDKEVNFNDIVFIDAKASVVKSDIKKARKYFNLIVRNHKPFLIIHLYASVDDFDDNAKMIAILKDLKYPENKKIYLEYILSFEDAKNKDIKNDELIIIENTRLLKKHILEHNSFKKVLLFFKYPNFDLGEYWIEEYPEVLKDEN